MQDDVVCISQARMTSTRLPGKILKEVSGRSLLDYHVRRLIRSRRISRLVVATTVNVTDDPVEAFCRDRNISCVRGSEDDVLSRYVMAVQQYPAPTVVRVTSDCPLIDPVLVDQVIDYYHENSEIYDYVRTSGENFPRGLDVEVFSIQALMAAHEKGQEPHEREHVTPYIYRPGSEFSCGIFPSDEAFGHHRWCVDEPADLEMVSQILKSFGGRDDFTWQDCIAVIEKKPAWQNINAQVQQKKLGD